MKQDQYRRKYYWWNIQFLIGVFFLLNIVFITYIKISDEKLITEQYQTTVEEAKKYLQYAVINTTQQVEYRKQRIVEEEMRDMHQLIELVIKRWQKTMPSEGKKSIDEFIVEIWEETEAPYQIFIWDRGKDQGYTLFQDKKNLLDVENEQQYNQLLEGYEAKVQRETKLGKVMTVVASNDKIKGQIKEEVSVWFDGITFSKTGHMWVNEIINYDGGDDYAIRLIHPHLKDTEGMLLSTHTQDVKGNFLYDEELTGIKEKGEVFLRYHFPKIHSDEISEMITYARLYPEYDWVVAAGIEMDEINQAFYENRQELKGRTNQYIWVVIGLTTIFLFVALLGLRVLNRYMYSRVFNQNQRLAIEKEELEDKYRRATVEANIDQLTNMYNRRFVHGYMSERWERYQKQNKNCCIIMGDIDNFKRMNDHLGHEFGDRTLSMVGQVLRDKVSEYDVAGRWGGEEFIVIINREEVEDAVYIAEKLRKAVEQNQVELDGQEYGVTISFGVSQFLPDDQEWMSAINRADRGMYMSKRSGKNRVTIYMNE